MPGPSIEIVTFTAFVVVQLALNIWELPLWQSMLSGVTKVLITGGGPEGGDVVAGELVVCPPLVAGAFVGGAVAGAAVVEG